jgi:hypothetical protein
MVVPSEKYETIQTPPCDHNELTHGIFTHFLPAYPSVMPPAESPYKHTVMPTLTHDLPGIHHALLGHV